MRARLITTCLLTVALLTTACGTQEPKAKLAGDDEVLARVNGSAVTRYDLERAIRDMLGERQAQALDQAGRRKMLESLVNSRAIAQAREKELAVEERAELEKEVAAFREERLVKQYLAKHTKPSPIGADAIQAYYEANAERFGGGSVRHYELLTIPADLSDDRRAKALAMLNRAEREPNWATWVESARQAGHPIALRTGEADDALLSPKLKQLAAQLSVGETSKLTFIDGAAYTLRIASERVLPARPLVEVRAEILRTLEPMRLSDAVKQASQTVLKGAEVAYR